MYLTYDEYISMGGTLDGAAFSIAERKAEYLINAQAAGRTGERIAELTELPQAVKDCIFELISFSSAFSASEKQAASESRSQGGESESISYVTKKDDEISAAQIEIISNYLYGGGCGRLLYRGACI